MPNEKQREFGQRLSDFLHEEKMLNFIPDGGWLSGGCRSLMKALQQWLGEDVALSYMLVHKPDREHAEHTFIKLGDFFLDGTGVSDFKQMRLRWGYEVGQHNVFIHPFNPSQEPPHPVSGVEPAYLVDSLIDELTEALAERFSKQEVLELFAPDTTAPKKVKIKRPASDISWWNDGIGQVCSVLSVFKETGYLQIIFTRTEKEAANDPTYQIAGWIDPQYVEIVE